jgi:hypothetical protein
LGRIKKLLPLREIAENFGLIRKSMMPKPTGNRYEIEILMNRMRKLKGSVTASLILKTINDNPYVELILNK